MFVCVCSGVVCYGIVVGCCCCYFVFGLIDVFFVFVFFVWYVCVCSICLGVVGLLLFCFCSTTCVFRLFCFFLRLFGDTCFVRLFVNVRVLFVMFLCMVFVFLDAIVSLVSCCLCGMSVCVSYVWVLLVCVCYGFVPLHVCLLVFVFVCEMLLIRELCCIGFFGLFACVCPCSVCSVLALTFLMLFLSL